MGFSGGNSEIADGSISIDKLANNILDMIFSQQVEQDLNILINSVAIASNLEDYSEMFIDIFTDSNGADNTLDTGNTTALFSVNSYNNLIGTPSDIDYPDPTFSSGSFTPKTGVQFTTKEAFYLEGATINGFCTATKMYLYDGGYTTILAQADIVANHATLNYKLDNSTTYILVVDNNGSNYVYGAKSGASYPITTEDELNFIHGWSNGAIEDTTNYNFVSLQKATGDNAVIQTKMEVLDSAPTKYYVYAENSVLGSGEVKARLSFDNGSTWENEVDLFTPTYYTGSGTQMIVQLKLNGVGSGNTAEASNYGVVVI